jgi:uncharacterized membrane protein YfcA
MTFARSVLVGSGAGFMGGLLGIGGGALVIPWLTRRNGGMTQLQAQGSVSPLNAATTLASSALFVWRQFVAPGERNVAQDIDVAVAGAASLAACVTAPIGVKLVSARRTARTHASIATVDFIYFKVEGFCQK